MDKKTYLNSLAKIAENAKRETNSLRWNFSYSHNSVRVGDTIEDHIGKGLVEKVNHGIFSSNHDLPECVYDVIILNKDGSPSKIKQNRRSVWQCNLVSINGKPVSKDDFKNRGL